MGIGMKKVLFLLASLGSLNVISGFALAEPLIHPAEAALPSQPDLGMTMRGLTRGPEIELESPGDSKSTTSPTFLKIRFKGRNNAAIERNSVKVTYLKSPLVDLTPRLQNYISADGIMMENAELPSGVHAIKVDVKDSQGRSSTALFKFLIHDK
jgi:hypothetical protein